MRSFSRRALQEKCEILQRHVRHKRLATEAELGDYAPGGGENPHAARTMAAWVQYHAQLVRFCGRDELHDHDAETADAVVLDALRSEPMAVELVALDDAGARRTVQVHPKGLDALLNLHARDWMLGWLAARLDVLTPERAASEGELVARALTEVSYHYAVLVWTVSTAGPGLPFDALLDERPVPPAWMRDLDPWDCLRIAQAHAVVNAQRLQAIDALIAPARETPEDGPVRPSWSVFVGELSIRMQHSPRLLMRDHALAELLAAVKTHGGAEREARDRADDARERAEQGAPRARR